MQEELLRQELLYQKSYVSENCSDSKENETKVISESESTDILSLLYSDLEFIWLSERVVSTKEFISLAKELSEVYLLDIRIIRFYDHVNVMYFFNQSGGMEFLKEIIAYADNIDFFANVKGYEIGLSLDHYTHAIYRNGKRIMPKGT